MSESGTQKFVEIENITDTVVTLRGGALRSVIEVTSVNFDLKSQDEQQGLIQAFQGFLNTVDFPLQILVQSRKLNIVNYLAGIAQMAENAPSELMQVQVNEYGRFIQGLSELANIMTKKFYIAVPYRGETATALGFMGKITGFFSKSKTTAQMPASPAGKPADAEFEKSKAQLEERVSVVANAITGVGVTARVLGAEELMNLYYGYYNFGQTIHT